MSQSTLNDTSRHEYRMRNRKVLPLILAGVLAIVVLPIFVLHGDFGAALVPACIFVPLGAGLIWFTLRSRLILEGTELTAVSMFQTRVVEQSEIEGIRTYSSRNGTYRALCLKRGGGPITFSNFSTDSAFAAWLEQFPDLDERDRKAALEKISEDQELGATPEERLEALTRAKRLYIAACAVAVAAAIGYSLAPMPWRLWCFVVVAMMPVLACFLLYRSPTLYALGKNRADPRVDMTLLLLIAGFGLFFRGVGLNYVSSGPLVEDGIFIGIVFLVALFRPATRGSQRAGMLIPVCLFAGLYAFGLVAGADTVSDTAAPRTFQTIVAGKHLRHGKSTTYYLTLEPWGPFAQARSVQVSASRYRETGFGDTVCVALHAGYLHADWYELVDCPASPIDAPMQ
jgi:hypothetical protein